MSAYFDEPLEDDEYNYVSVFNILATMKSNAPIIQKHLQIIELEKIYAITNFAFDYEVIPKDSPYLGNPKIVYLYGVASEDFASARKTFIDLHTFFESAVNLGYSNAVVVFVATIDPPETCQSVQLIDDQCWLKGSLDFTWSNPGKKPSKQY